MSDKYQARKAESSWLETDSPVPCSPLGQQGASSGPRAWSIRSDWHWSILPSPSVPQNSQHITFESDGAGRQNQPIFAA